jgi:ABC-type transport system involved in multi-copper enzyme maturation permease subunit
MSSKMLWLIIAGGILPPVISALMFLSYDSISWKEFINASMDVFNSQSVLTFACFMSFIWAREYEENTMEITLCYPYPKYYLMIGKLIVLLLVIITTSLLWVVGTGISGAFLVQSRIDQNIVMDTLKVLGPIIIMQFMLLPITFFITMLSKQMIAGVVVGVIGVALCTVFQTSDFIQYIPFCIPLVISQHLFGFSKILLDHYSTSWSILIGSFVVFISLSCFTFKKKWEFR